MANNLVDPPQGARDYIEYSTENGRAYSTKGNYLFPIDEGEQDRLDRFHSFFVQIRQAMGSVRGLHARPIENNAVLRVLDLGCGTGIWCNEMAELYPSAKVIGLDTCLRIQPQLIPPGVGFQGQDITDPNWDLEKDSMDLIHMQLLGGCVANWTTLYQTVFNHLKPSLGVFEHIEIDFRPFSKDGSLPQDAEIYRWTDQLYEAFDTHGKPLWPREDLASTLEKLGFVEVEHQQQEIPFHPWPESEDEQDIGRWFNLGMQPAISSMSRAPLMRYGNWRLEDLVLFENRVRLEICTHSKRFSCTMHVWHARKP
ncbi:methyltransferase LaeA [Apiospora arundinis]|uniref:Methyltransferase LaeA n=1 Tax=Apiospora arundinis TaxID=335852 RepID=A0ABR2IWZ3_9PEZI